MRYLNDNHVLTFVIDGPVENIKVNPTFGHLGEGSAIELLPNSVRIAIAKMTAERPQESHYMLRVASYRVKTDVSDLPLLLASYWKKENDDYRVRVVAKPSQTIQNLKLLSKVIICE
jgi:hypothetical protein